MKIKVEFEHHPIAAAPSDYLEWYAHIPDMLGLGESGKTKLEAFNELMLSLKVLVAYENKVDLT